MRSSAAVIRLHDQKPIKLDDGPKTISLLQAEIWRAGGDYKKIADKAGCAYTTVANIASGNTKRPAHSTIVRIFMALGWSVFAQQDGR